MYNKRVYFLTFILGLFLTLSIIAVSAAPVTIIAPAANTAQRGNTNFSANFSTLANVTEANVTNISLELINDNGTSYNLTVSNGNAVNFTVLSINLNTNNGTFGDANYTFRAGVTFSNGTRATASNANITVDNTAPVVTLLQPAAIYLQNYTNVSVLQDTNLTFRATDVASASHMNCTVEYDTDFNGVGGDIKVENAAVTNNTLTNFSKFNQTVNGAFTLTVVCKDNAGNEGISGTSIPFTVDNVAPNKSAISFDSATPGFGDDVKITCLGTDNVGPFNINITVRAPSQTSFSSIKSVEKGDAGTPRSGDSLTTTFTGTRELGTYIVACNLTDTVDNVNSTNKTFEVTRKVVNRRFTAAKAAAEKARKKIIGEGAGANIGSITQKSLARLMQKGSTISFTVQGEDHKLTVQSFGADSVTIVVESEPQEYTINAGETKQIDVDGDGAADMKVTYNGEDTDKKAADVTIEGFDKAEAAGPGAESDREEGARAADTAAADTGVGKAGSTMFWVILVIVVILIIYAVTKGKGGKKRK